jgi:aspartyl-tRNA(Asn)/glutamyl-tRNA(Gln) amidotransferase subunit A
MENLYSLTAHELKEKIDKNGLAPSDIFDSLLRRIESLDKKIKAFVSVNKSAASAMPENKAGKLYGIPVLVKDNICVKGEETTCASRILAGFKPPYDATVIKRLKAEGAILIGKANMDEFAFGSSCETSCYGPTRNPWDTDRIPGGCGS